MSLINIHVDVSMGGTQEEVLAQMKEVLPQAIESVVEFGYQSWVNMVKQAKMPPFEKKAYIESIDRRMTSLLTGEIWTDYDRAELIDSGVPAWDMKRMLQTSSRTRISHSRAHEGQKYLIIPFRHGVPGANALSPAMPKEIYAKAKFLSPSVVSGKTKRVSATGKKITKLITDWGGKLPAGLAPKKKFQHKTDIFAGMVKVDTSAGKAKSSTYLTFRVMGEWQSAGWIYPKRHPELFAHRLNSLLTPLLDDSVTKALSLSKTK